MKINKLRCEYLKDPLGIDTTKPRLSWVLESDQRGQKQKAYRVLVASSEKNLSDDIGDLWDSGRVESDETAHILYAGKSLKSRMYCYWKVCVWDRNGQTSSWSQPAIWSMGLLKEADWKAQWIGFDEPRKGLSGDPLLPPVRYLRKDFESGKPVRRATLYVTALGLYEVHINGHRIGEDYLAPCWTDYNKRVYYNTYDVTDTVNQGVNAIGAMLGDGWYSGHIGYGHKRDHYGSKTRLRAQLVLDYEDGTSEVVATDRRWKASTGPLLEADFLMGVTYDARKEMPGWDEPGFDSTGWKRVNVTSNITAVVEAYPGVTIKKFRELKPVKITEPKPGVFVFDMGSNFAGFARLNVMAPRGKKIKLRFAERLNPNGTVYTKNLRSARTTDIYICRGGGQEVWEPRFTYHGFQYVELTGYVGKPDKNTITGIEITSAAPTAGTFECSSSMLNKLHRNIIQTQRANFMDIPTDCPQRDERLGWTGDAQIYIPTACWNSDVHTFFNKWLVDLTDAQREDGQFPCVAPMKVSGSDGGAAWADAGVICPWTIYRVYGDTQILEKYYDRMKRFIAFCKKRSPGLLPPEEFHCYGDWLSIRADTPKDVITEAYFAYSTGLLARIAEALGKKGDTAKYNKLFEDIKAAFNTAYVADDGRIKGNTQAVYVLALAFDLVDGEKRDRAVQYLVDDIKSRNWHLSTGFVGTKDLMLVLTKIGRTDVAYRLLHNDTFPSWGFSIKHGATSIWERWDGWTPDKGFQDPGMNSFSHYSLGAVGQWMFENIGGINTDGPGFKRILIHPRPGGKITWAKVSYDSIRGLIVSDWKVRDSRFELSISIPANTTATVYLPAKDPKNVTENGKPVSKAKGVKFLRLEEGCAVFEVESGNYSFVGSESKD